ncbi:hypothetical protein [Subtercola boreus]|uniref:Uncharacterized protein n=1 Tax=Subtercola boreus TaxID=120213 RepID=A0A3E0WBS9_9MICO|nr:hypothetical protein [Subtercola boreus]RFA20589.1 hypothetical protein B7R24_09155 [Subtercola boreus]RFA20704.1 hypothetical protein B7R23_09090 [Subtercola boreus]RFA26914.1 hypothetical protein B7R25_09220 [Subtercola boreus]
MTNSPAKSPIQRRIAIDRTRVFARIAVIGGVLYAFFATWLYIRSGFEVTRLPVLLLGPVFVVQGIAQLKRAATLTADLEREFGAQAGVQERRRKSE